MTTRAIPCNFRAPLSPVSRRSARLILIAEGARHDDLAPSGEIIRKRHLEAAFPARGIWALKNDEQAFEKKKREPLLPIGLAAPFLGPFPLFILLELYVGRGVCFASRALVRRIARSALGCLAAVPNLAAIVSVVAERELPSLACSKERKNQSQPPPHTTGRLLPLRAPARQGLRRARPQAPRVVVQPPQDRAHHGLE